MFNFLGVCTGRGALGMVARGDGGRQENHDSR